jgi:hypothetical protein
MIQPLDLFIFSVTQLFVSIASFSAIVYQPSTLDLFCLVCFYY